MELDKRIKSINDIQSVLNSTKDSVGKVGYLAKSIKNFKNLSKCKYGTVDMYREDDECFCHEMRFTNGTTDNTWYSYFIPKDKLEFKEKKYRPYTIKEFEEIFLKNELDGFITFREKDEPNNVYTLRYNGNFISDNIEYVCLGAKNIACASLFRYYEVANNDGEFVPFGVEE